MNIFSTRITLFFAVWLAASAASVRAQGGPPMLTDDPGTPPGGHWEINLAFITAQSRDGNRQDASPLLDLNYGVTDRFQLIFDLPWTTTREPGQPTRAGLGDISTGVKWRFFDDTAGSGFAMSTAPQISFRSLTSSVNRGLSDGGTALLLPVEFIGTLGPLTWNAEVGRFLSNRADEEWSYGVALGRCVSPRLELGVELHGTGRFSREDDTIVANLGARIRLTEHRMLLVSAGRSINRTQGTELKLIGYLGLQQTY